jgi:hypothetical protein
MKTARFSGNGHEGKPALLTLARQLHAVPEPDAEINAAIQCALRIALPDRFLIKEHHHGSHATQGA